MADQSREIRGHPAMVTLKEAYSRRNRGVVVLTGGIHDIFWNESTGAFITLEQDLAKELDGEFDMVRMDAANGITFYDEDSKQRITRTCQATDGLYVKTDRISNLESTISQGRGNPLPSLITLRWMSDAYLRMRRLPQGTRPLCIVVQFAGSIFPDGDYSKLSELDRQRLVTFLDWINDPRFMTGDNLVILVSDTRSEINRKIFMVPTTEAIEIPLPDTTQRQQIVEHALRGQYTSLANGLGQFVDETAGLTLTGIRDLLEESSRTGVAVTSKAVIDKVNALLQAQLGDIIKVNRPTHGPDDVCGYEKQKIFLRKAFRRCDRPKRAVSGILLSGPNGGGKTFLGEAFAADSGRIVIEIGNVRGNLFGDTDRFFELLRWNIVTYGKIAIFVDEAATAFGSVHKGDTHETEMRLAGNVLKMMGDPSLLGKIVWVLMTSRPDELDPDIKDRCSIQIPVLDLEGDERRAFVKDLFARSGIEFAEGEVEKVLERTGYYSNRSYAFLIAEVLAERDDDPSMTVLRVLDIWSASTSIQPNRRLQTLIASEHCTYRQLLSPTLAEMTSEDIAQQIATLKWAMTRS